MSTTYEMTIPGPLAGAIQTHKDLRPVHPDAVRAWRGSDPGRSNSLKMSVPLDDLISVLVWIRTMRDVVFNAPVVFSDRERIAMLKLDGEARRIAGAIALDIEREFS